MKRTRLYFVRHAEVEERYHRVFGGRIDMGLSDLGREQARRLAEYLQRLPLEAVYASPMRRVRQTIEPLNGHLMPSPVFDDALREFDFGQWTGLHFRQVREQFNADPWDWLEWIEHGRIPEGETGAQIRARLEPWLQDKLARHSGQTVAVFAHGGVIRQLLASLLEMPLPRMALFDVDYASVAAVDAGGGRHPEIQLANYTPWKTPGT